MAKNKYAADYRLIETFDEKGHVQVTTEYIGKWYRYTQDEEVVKKQSRILCLFCLAGWILYIGALLPYSGHMRFLAIALPYVFSALPLAVFTDLAFTLARQESPFEHRIADRIETVWPRAAMSVLVLDASAAVFGLIRLAVTGELTAGNLAVTLCSALLAAGAWNALARRRYFTAREADSKG